MRVGFVAGAFDLLHAGHLHLLKQCKHQCDYLVVGLHVDPSKQREGKNKPIESLVAREIRLDACSYVNKVITYETEEELSLIFKYWKIDVRFLGSDYELENKKITDPEAIPIEYIESLPIHTSDIRERIKNS